MCQDRVVIDEETRDRLGSLLAVARAAPAVVGYALKLRARPRQAARAARVSVSFGAICGRAPAPRGPGGGPAAGWVGPAPAGDPPAGVDPLEWVLTVGFPVETAEGALRAVGIYGQRPVIEVCQADCVSRDSLCRSRGAADSGRRGAVSTGTMESAAPTRPPRRT